MKKTLCILALVVVLILAAIVGGSYFMLHFSLDPMPNRQDTTALYQWLYEEYPETRPWMDSLRRVDALRDTFVTMPTGERHHAIFVRNPHAEGHTAVLVHGWRDQSIKMLQIARIYEQLLGYNILLPDLHAHGLSEGNSIGMGWNDRKDVLHWMQLASQLFHSHDFVVHGVSMGAATTMNVSGEPMPKGISKVLFVEDCGYTSVWDEFHFQLGEDFGLPDFPLMYTTNLLCQWKNGWSFNEAAPINQVAKCKHPMLFIHGDNDHFVPSWMVHPLYEAKQGIKELWITKGTEHAESYKDYPQEYTQHVVDFVKKHQ